MNELLLSTALTVARQGRFTKAAGELFVSVQGVKKRVDALEAELGVALFERGAHVTTGTEGVVTLSDSRCVPLN